MTAFDNIKVNNWPATSNDSEDFLVLKMPLNDSASLTESLPVVAGSQELFPKRTLSNFGVQPTFMGSGTRVWSSAFVSGSSSTLPFRNSKTITDPFGPVDSVIETATNQNGEVIYLDFANNGGALTGYSTIKFRSGGLNAGNRGVFLNGNSASAGALDVAINISGQTINNIQVKSVVSNAGAGFAGIELDGVRLIDPSHRKHYDNNAFFDSNAYMQLAAADPVFNFGKDDFCIEYYFKADNLSSAYRLFQLGLEINWTENIEMQMNTNGTIDYDIWPGGSVAQSNYGFTGTQTFTAGTWNHVAFTRQGSTFRGFLNGVADGSATYAGIISSPTLANNRPSFGCRTNGSATAISGPRLVGSIQDFRLYRGTAKYTSAFTPPGAILV